jgi:hypothetical protein
MAGHGENIGQEKIHADVWNESLNQQILLEDIGVNVGGILKPISSAMVRFWLAPPISAQRQVPGSCEHGDGH